MSETKEELNVTINEVIFLIERFVINPVLNKYNYDYKKIQRKIYDKYGPIRGIIFQGKTISWPFDNIGTRYLELPEEYEAEFLTCFENLNKITQDKTFISTNTISVLKTLDSLQEIRQLIPDFIFHKGVETNALQHIEYIPRSVPIEEGNFNFVSKYLKKNYLYKVLPKLDYYLALKFIM